MPFETPNLVSSDICIPQQIKTGSFVIRPLEVTDAKADYNAVMESRDRIKNTFGPNHPWPPTDLTLEQNRIDLAWHQKEHQRRDSFTYTIYHSDTETELGCLYIQPTRIDDYHAAVYFWTSTTADQRNLVTQITASIRRWISEDWPLENVTYPGRNIPWEEWQTLKSN